MCQSWYFCSSSYIITTRHFKDCYNILYFLPQRIFILNLDWMIVAMPTLLKDGLLEIMAFS